MPKLFSSRISEGDRIILSKERYTHPHPKVQRRMEVIHLIGNGLTIKEAARLSGVSHITAKRHAAIYKNSGLEGLRVLKWRKRRSKLVPFKSSIEESFRRAPPHSVNEACERIRELTGLERRPTQVRVFLKKHLG